MRISIHKQGLGYHLPPGYGGLEVVQDETTLALSHRIDLVSEAEARLVHLFGVYEITLATLADLKARGKLTSLTTVYWLWGGLGYSDGLSELHRDLVASCYASADLLFPCSPGEARRIHNHLAIPVSKMRVAVCGIWPDIETRVSPEKSAAPWDDYALVVGRLEPRKNQLSFLTALMDDPTPVILVGDAPPSPIDPTYAARCREIAGRRPAPTLILPGMPHGQVLRLMQDARVVVQPSIYECQGLVCLEAAALGTPVVPTIRSFAGDYLGDGTLYVDPFSPESLKGAVSGFRPITETLRRRLLTEYTWPRAADQMVGAYKEFLSCNDK